TDPRTRKEADLLDGTLPGGRGGRTPTVTAADKAQARTVSLRRIAGLFREHRTAVAVVTVLIVASSVVTMAQPFLLREVIDVALPQADLTLLIQLVAGMIG